MHVALCAWSSNYINSLNMELKIKISYMKINTYSIFGAEESLLTL